MFLIRFADGEEIGPFPYHKLMEIVQEDLDAGKTLKDARIFQEYEVGNNGGKAVLYYKKEGR